MYYSLSLIYQGTLKLTKNVVIWVISYALISCNSLSIDNDSKYQDFKSGEITLPSQKKIKLKILYSAKEHAQGLSGVTKEKFSKDQGVLFYNRQSANQQFWMINTFFNIDIVFLDSDLTVLEINRNMPAHPNVNEPPAIAFTKIIFARHVLEVRSDSDMAKEIKKGIKLNWSGKPSLLQIESNIHHFK